MCVRNPLLLSLNETSATAKARKPAQRASPHSIIREPMTLFPFSKAWHFGSHEPSS
jgi:hypothetical protein